ncbi:MAG TPA: polysaccharide deacetylase family protein, partial [Thermomicrobiales bacterium]|nr:polysaccharide deacetylase family protein [Thermomicrobiales bacterium]
REQPVPRMNRHRHQRAWAMCALLVLVPLLTACGGSGKSDDVSWAAWSPDPTEVVAVAPATDVPATLAPTNPPATEIPADAPSAATEIPQVAPTTAPQVASVQTESLSPDELRTLQPNELGAVPVLMYHAFTSDPSLVAEFTRLSDDFRDDLQWLYDHDFHVITMRDLLDNRIDIPAGKHPVVLTFDDASPGQFLFVKDENGELVPGPTSAVGIMEAFFAEHPDFGHTAHFAIVPNYCFGLDTEYNTPDYCKQKLDYLVDHGYEIGNHTSWHDNLSELTTDGVAEEVGGAAVFIDEHVQGPANLSRVLTLPYGQRPDPETHPEASALLTDGFTYKGDDIRIEAEIEVSGGPAYSPSSAKWDPFAITRFNTDDASLNQWFPAFENGDVVLYTSDGNPDTITVPDPLPSSLEGQLDPGLIASQGYQLIQYDPESGDITTASASVEDVSGPHLTLVTWRADRLRIPA